MTCSKDRRPPFRRPRIEKRTRHDSNVRPQASQTCALIPLSYGFKLQSGGGATRTHRGVDARRLSTPLHYLLCGASEVWRKVRESNPQEHLRSDSFRDCLACPCPTFQRCIRRGSNPHAHEERQLYRLLPDRFGV